MESIDELIGHALEEDNARKDITVRSLVLKNIKAKAEILCKERGIVCGVEILKGIFKKLDKNIVIKTLVKDGNKVKKGERIAVISGSASALLSGERTALNFIQHLSGIATLTRKFVDKIKGKGRGKGKIKIYDTRKTTPGLRELEKYAVRCGGGINHRFDLNEMAMIKDNHLKLFPDIKAAVKKIRKKYPNDGIEVECSKLNQVKEAAVTGVDVIMLDNMPLDDMRKGISMIRKYNRKIQIEVSGRVNLTNIKRFGKLDIDRISVGVITHSAPSLDISLEIL
ncbi:MAG: carboxylating nicotinate-nucleotide diphosphorylase [Elusimicrobia bacterium]|nr:carboxylating nicotinate-nucleotide diphosphorylase [Candidatus Liberimonas magnetica]